MDSEYLREVIETLSRWRDTDAPMVEAIGNTLVATSRFDSQEQARRVLSTVIDVLREELGG